VFDTEEAGVVKQIDEEVRPNVALTILIAYPSGQLISDDEKKNWQIVAFGVNMRVFA